MFFVVVVVFGFERVGRFGLILLGWSFGPQSFRQVYAVGCLV